MAAELLVKPFPNDTVDEGEVRAFWSTASETEDVYVPGSKMKSVSLVDNVAPTVEPENNGQRVETDAYGPIRIHTIRNICFAIETLVGIANSNRLALSSCWEASEALVTGKKRVGWRGVRVGWKVMKKGTC